MSKETAETKAAKRLELSIDKLDTVVDGYSREDWDLINQEIEKHLLPEGR